MILKRLWKEEEVAYTVTQRLTAELDYVTKAPFLSIACEINYFKWYKLILFQFLSLQLYFPRLLSVSQEGCAPFGNSRIQCISFPFAALGDLCIHWVLVPFHLQSQNLITLSPTFKLQLLSWLWSTVLLGSHRKTFYIIVSPYPEKNPRKPLSSQVTTLILPYHVTQNIPMVQGMERRH